MKYTIPITQKASKLVAALTFEEKISEICCPVFDPEQVDAGVTGGSVFVHPAKKGVHRESIAAFKAKCKFPPLATTDLEEGPGRMIIGATPFPSMAGAAALNKKESLYSMGKIAALEGGELGYNWTLAPCVDIGYNPDTPTTTLRSAGETTEKVIAMTSAYIKGCQDHGMMATAKHFPGDGFGIYDQHLTTPEIPLSTEEWRKTSGKVYQTLIDEGVMSIMPGHISFPAYDTPHPSNGLCPPASMSKRLLGDLLRGELGFDGLIVSDAINMSGFCGFVNFFEACAGFVEAGGDILLFAVPTPEFIGEMRKQVEKGNLTEKSVTRSALRVLSLKDKLGILADSEDTVFSRPVEIVDHEAHLAAAREITKDALTIVRDRNNLLPIPQANQKKVLHLCIFSSTVDEEEKELIRSLDVRLEGIFKSVDHLEDPGGMAVRAIARSGKYDYIICSIGNSYKFGTNVIRLHGKAARNMMSGWTKFDTPCLFICHHHHRTHEEYAAVMDTVINTYGSTELTWEPLGKMLIDGGNPA